MTETARLVAEFQKTPVSQFLSTYAEHASELERAMERMRTPWLDMENKMRSITAFAELQSIGQRLRSLPAFGDELAAGLRSNLGDWRDPITWPSAIFTDLDARSDFYESLGFDAALTDFPATAFEQSLDIASIRRRPPCCLKNMDLRSRTPAMKPRKRTSSAQMRRMSGYFDFESRFRAFIDERMTRAYGPHWPRAALPNGLYEQWLQKKIKAEKGGGKERPLIAYADFTDYERVITRGDNWREVFAPFFGRQESLRESLQRLYPIRLDTMHARLITQDDELLLYVETRRLMKVILVRST